MKGLPPIRRIESLEWVLALILFGAVTCAGFVFQKPITVNRGLGYDGIHYYKTAEQFSKGSLPRGGSPYIYRLGTPFLAALVSGKNLIAGFKSVNLAAAALSAVLLTVWLRSHVAGGTVRFLLAALFITQWHAPARFAHYYPVLVDSCAFVFLIAGLLAIDRGGTDGRSRWNILLPALSFAGLLFRDLTAVIPLAALVKAPRAVRSWAALAAAGLAAWTASHLATRTGGEPGAIKVILHWVSAKKVPGYLLAWLIAFGPVIFLPIYAWRSSLAYLRRNAHLAVYLSAFAVLGYVGGSDTERLLYFSMPVVYALIGRAIEEKRAVFVFLPALALLVVSQCIAQRIFWTTPDFQNAFRPAPMLLTPLSSKFPNRDLYSFYGSRLLNRQAFWQYALLGSTLLLLWAGRERSFGRFSAKGPAASKKDPPPAQTPPEPPRLRQALLALSGLIALNVAAVASKITLAYSESYDILLDARALAAGKPELVSSRPPLLPLVLTPAAWLDKAFGHGLLFRVSSLLAFLCWAGAAYALYRLLRLGRLGKPLCLIPALLLALNPLLLQTAPILREEPAALLSSLACLFFYQKTVFRNRPKDYRRLSFCAALAVASDYRLFVLFAFSIPLIETVRSLPRAWREKDMALLFESGGRARLMAWTLALPLAVFSAAAAAAHGGPGSLPGYFRSLGVLAYGSFTWSPENGVQNLGFLAAACPAPLLALAGIGLAAAFARDPRRAWIQAGWFAAPAFLLFYALRPDGGRALVTIIPAVYLFAARGIDFFLSIPCRKAARASLVALVAIALVPSVREAGRGLARFGDPVYTADFGAAAGRKAAELAAGHGLFWLGHTHYALAPRDAVFHPADDHALIYYFTDRVLSFYSGRNAVNSGVFQLPFSPELAPFALPDGVVPQDGDAFIFNPETLYVTKTLPPPRSRRPLVLGKMRWLSFRFGGQEPGGRRLYVQEGGGGMLSLNPAGDPWLLSAKEVPDGLYEVYFDKDGKRTRLFWGKIQAKGRGWLDFTFRPAQPLSAAPARFFLLTTESVTTMDAPGTKRLP
ncbi:MAG TPA: hypothetical protein VL404_09575 [Candidatus Eisenbacteria bacterium]|nr:hypothetical protein [Candidatus Eisenbacteria bacterium]